MRMILAALLALLHAPLWAQSDDYDVLLSERLDTEESFGRFVVVNANDDSQTWQLGLQGTCIRRTSTMSNDDWLLSPEVELKAGRSYTLSYTAKCVMDDREERLTVLTGKGTDVAAYTTTIAGERAFSSKQEERVTVTFTATATGRQRVAFRDVSPAGQAQSFYLRDVELLVAVSEKAPRQATDVVVTPDAEGALRATVTFRTPTLARDGTATTLSRAELWRGDNVVAATETPTPGDVVSLTDEGEGMKAGVEQSYTIAVYNDEGRSRISVSAYVGEDYPKAPAAAVLSDEGHEAVVSWTAVSEGIRGHYINTSRLRYTIEDEATGNVVASQVEGTQYVLPFAPDEGTLCHRRYTVYASTATGDGPSTATNGIVTGQPLPLQFVEHFADDAWQDGQHWWTASKLSNWAEWVATRDGSDGDGASVNAHTYHADEELTLGTAKLCLQGATRPRVVFSHKAMPGADARISVYADKLPQGQPVRLYTYDYTSLPEGQGAWTRAAVDLTAYGSEPYVVLLFVAQAAPGSDLLLDDVQVYDVPRRDLAVSVKAPKKAKTGRQADIVVEVENLGEEAVGDYSVELSAGDRLIERRSGLQVEAYGHQSLHFALTPLVTDPAQLTVEAVVTCSGDADDSNSHATATMRLEQSTLPVAEALRGTVSSNAVTLTWEAPEGGVDYTTEDFEDYDAFADDLSPWTTIDGDGLPIFDVQDVNFPQNGQPMAFIVFNPTEAGWTPADAPTTAPHSGNQYVASFAPDDNYAANDDWLISPELTAGEEQTVSFFARAVSSYYGGDGFDMLYSTTGCRPEDFVYKVNETLCEAQEGRWTEFFADIPEEARYFAIHYTSPGSVGLLIDDITWLAPTPEPTGYNIYRDNTLIGHTDDATTTFSDKNPTGGLHTYYVTALYGNEESALSEPFVASVATGIKAPSTPETAHTVYNLQGQRLYGAHKSYKSYETYKTHKSHKTYKSQGNNVIIIK